jgi:hypothetical protein
MVRVQRGDPDGGDGGSGYLEQEAYDLAPAFREEVEVVDCGDSADLLVGGTGWTGCEGGRHICRWLLVLMISEVWRGQSRDSLGSEEDKGVKFCQTSLRSSTVHNEGMGGLL